LRKIYQRFIPVIFCYLKINKNENANTNSPFKQLQHFFILKVKNKEAQNPLFLIATKII
jgi:hypothetical protein